MVIRQIADLLQVSEPIARTIYTKARAGGEFDGIDEQTWFTERFSPNIVWISEAGYAHMAVDALKILGGTAATDYGSSRQRDLGQLWGDMTRGYLAEYATQLYLAQRWSVGIELGHEAGEMETFLDTDIHAVRTANDDDWRPPNLRVSIKSTKWNGIWLDIPGAQFHHSDVHILVKVGVSRDHLFAYLKYLSVFRDKVLQQGISSGVLSETEADVIYELLPDFEPIPAYISGFALRDHPYRALPYGGRKGKKHYTVTTWEGAIEPGDLDEIRRREALPEGGAVKFEGIGSFAHNRGYLFNVGSLLWGATDWQALIRRL